MDIAADIHKVPKWGWVVAGVGAVTIAIFTERNKKAAAAASDPASSTDPGVPTSDVPADNVPAGGVGSAQDLADPMGLSLPGGLQSAPISYSGDLFGLGSGAPNLPTPEGSQAQSGMQADTINAETNATNVGASAALAGVAAGSATHDLTGGGPPAKKHPGATHGAPGKGKHPSKSTHHTGQNDHEPHGSHAHGGTHHESHPQSAQPTNAHMRGTKPPKTLRHTGGKKNPRMG